MSMSRFSLAPMLVLGMAVLGIALGSHARVQGAEPAAALPSGAALVCEGDDPGPDPVRLETARLRGDRYIADRASGAVAELTLDPRLQAATERLLRRSQIKYGASVVLSIPDGKVLALAGRSSVDPSAGATEMALRPWAPAASVFKLVSAVALVEEAGLNPDTRACYHGGVSSVPARQPGRQPAPRRSLRLAGVRHRQVAKRDPGQAGDPAPVAHTAGTHRPCAGFRGAAGLRPAGGAVAPGRTRGQSA